MQFKKLEFTNDAGEKLSARLDFPKDDQPLAYALFAHCFTCSKNIKAISHISRALTRNGIAVMRFDFTGLGESEGDFADTNFSSNVGDLVMAAEFMASQYEAPKILIGHSLGGAAVLQAAASAPRYCSRMLYSPSPMGKASTSGAGWALRYKPGSMLRVI